MVQKTTIIVWDANVNNINVSKLIKTKTNSKCLIASLDEVMKPLVLRFPKMSGYVIWIDAFLYKWWEAIKNA